jgi:hypothetical protein
VTKARRRKGRKENDLSVRPLRRRLLHLAASLRPRLASSDPNKNSPFAHAFGRRNQFPVRSRVRPSKAPPRSPSFGTSPQYVGTKHHQHHQLSLQLPSAVLPLLPRHHCRRAPLLPDQKSPGKLHARPAPLAETVDITHDIPAHFHAQRHLHGTSPRILDLTSSSPNPQLHYLSSRFRRTVRPPQRRLLHFAASLRPRLASSDPNKNSPFAHAFGRRNQFPVRSRVRLSKAPPRSPSLGT